MLHLGYLFGANPDNHTGFNMEGGTYGIGGALRVHLWKVFRVGAEGYVSTMPSALTTMRRQLASGSYLRNGWGGVVADACFRGHKLWPFIGFSMGGGAERTLLIESGKGSQDDWEGGEGTVFHKQSFFYTAPYLGVDVVLTPHVHVTVKADWLLAVHKVRLVQPTGPRLYLGIMFCR